MNGQVGEIEGKLRDVDDRGRFEEYDKKGTVKAGRLQKKHWR